MNDVKKGFRIDFNKAMHLFYTTQPHDLDDFCQNEAFGYFFNRNNDSIENRKLYAFILKSYISKVFKVDNKVIPRKAI